MNHKMVLCLIYHACPNGFTQTDDSKIFYFFSYDINVPFINRLVILAIAVMYILVL